MELGADEVGAAWEAVASDADAAAAEPVFGSGWPHFGQATHAGSSRIAWQFGQRAGANGSGLPHAGQAATSRLMNSPQWGHGCLNVGIVPSLSARLSAGCG